MGSEEPRLPPGYRLDRSDPDVLALRRPEGWVVAHFPAQGATKEAIEQTAWEDHERAGEKEYPRRRLTTTYTIIVGIGLTGVSAA